ncbi:hypothetical protein KBTX_03395 [wastewater metagenome]|uniref:Uncharacterized protein n=2 Tax=unclassified sequences TaxID=12908 RepID=A0A5B8RDX0_9ZZZZ|nr:hypothetical protein KBTEX_03395 [uncultured organism]
MGRWRVVVRAHERDSAAAPVGEAGETVMSPFRDRGPRIRDLGHHCGRHQPLDAPDGDDETANAL